MSVVGTTKWWAKEYLCSAGGHLADVTRLLLFPLQHLTENVPSPVSGPLGQASLLYVGCLRNLSQLNLS